MYQIGDLIYHGGTGVCRITDIAEQSFPGAVKGLFYYSLKPLYQECVIYTPVGSDKVFMRPIISKDEAERLISLIPTIQADPYYSKVISQVAEHYTMSLKTHNCEDLIELTMSIYAKKHEAEEQKRKFNAVDERFMKRAEELLFSELSAALGIPKNDVPEYIASRVAALSEEEDAEHANEE